MSLEKQKRVLVFFPSCVGLSPVPHQGGGEAEITI